MKKIILLLAISGLVSCTDFLDMKPQNKVIPQTAEEYSALLNSELYDIEFGMSGYIILNYSEIYSLETAMDDLDINASPGPEGIPVYLGTIIHDFSPSYYKGFYDIIATMNMILEGLEDDQSELAVKVKAAAYAIRGLVHFNLLRFFCEPVVDGEYPLLGISCMEHFDMEAKPNRMSYQRSVEFIEDDFKKALSLNLLDETYMFTADVVEAFMARFYFWVQDWDNALTMAEKVLTKYPLVNGQDYLDMFDGLEPKGNVILKSKIYSGTNSNKEEAMFEALRSRPVNKTLIDQFDYPDGDIRFELMMDELRQTEKRPIGCIRGAEMAFIIAECHYHKGDNQKALDMINTIRRNRISDYTDLTMNDLPDVDFSSIIKVDATGDRLTPLISLILNERRKEFFMEGDRFFERKRNGCPENWVANGGRAYTNNSFMYTFPIPYRETRLIDGLKQNPGYEQITSN